VTNRRSSWDIEGEVFDLCLRCRRTGDDLEDLREISRAIARCLHFTDTIGPSPTLDAAHEYLKNLTGQILMARLHGHEAPYTPWEYATKDTLHNEIEKGLRQPELADALDEFTREIARLQQADREDRR